MQKILAILILLFALSACSGPRHTIGILIGTTESENTIKEVYPTCNIKLKKDGEHIVSSDCTKYHTKKSYTTSYKVAFFDGRKNYQIATVTTGQTNNWENRWKKFLHFADKNKTVYVAETIPYISCRLDTYYIGYDNHGDYWDAYNVIIDLTTCKKPTAEKE
ncbi:hypothetical protein L6259_00495 [Candidatus Parcubacteria bacterium]|nr:hypothetical protein [Patescibacteria group bacterium]MCG2693753.1 hypothetical protein [Candidatus Parcubacteria bacterium]